jgi:hypothetical protein
MGIVCFVMTNHRAEEQAALGYIRDCAGHEDDASVETFAGLLGLSYPAIGERERFRLFYLLVEVAGDLARCEDCGGGPRAQWCNSCDERGHMHALVKVVLDAVDAYVGSDCAAE